MRPVQVTVSALGASAPIVLDLYQAPFAVGLNVRVTGTLTYSVQHTFDDPFAAGFDPATANWNNHSTMAALTATADGNYAFPVRAIRLNVTAFTSGSAVMSVIQATGSNA